MNFKAQRDAANPKIPIATYRLQFNKHFTFKQALDLVDYLHHLGISHCYASPIFYAKPGSLHGYDIIDHSKINPEIGTEEEFEALVKALNNLGMGIILDIVPNHMFIIDPHNQWWHDVLENGTASPYACYFDIDWHPPRTTLDSKVLLPLLEQQYGDALEKGALKINYEEGKFILEMNGLRLPTDPKSWSIILEPVEKAFKKTTDEDNFPLLELESIITSLNHLPTTKELSPEKIEERQREKEVIKRRLKSLLNKNEPIAKLVINQIESLNGKPNEPQSFDELEKFAKFTILSFKFLARCQ